MFLSSSEFLECNYLYVFRSEVTDKAVISLIRMPQGYSQFQVSLFWFIFVNLYLRNLVHCFRAPARICLYCVSLCIDDVHMSVHTFIC